MPNIEPRDLLLGIASLSPTYGEFFPDHPSRAFVAFAVEMFGGL